MSTLQPTLENDLVLIRPLAEEDFEVLYNAAKDPLIWEQHPADRYKQDEFKAFFKVSVSSKGALIIIDKSTNQVIGSSRYKPVAGKADAVEIGWSFLARKYWGGQYNGIVKSLMINHAFLHFEEVIFYIASANVRSQKAVEKLGAKLVTNPSYQSTTLNNDLTYQIQRKDWF